MLDQKIVDETYTASVEYARQQYHFEATKEAFIAGAQWMEKHLEENKYKDALAPLVPERISCGGY